MSIICPVHIPACPVSETTTPFAGSAWAISRQMRSGRMGTASDASIGSAAAEPMLASDAVPMRPERICREIAQALPANGVVVSDTGHAGMWTGQMIDITKLGQRYIRCEGSLGWGLPGAMGVKCALPDRPVLLFTGAGGLYYPLP